MNRKEKKEAKKKDKQQSSTQVAKYAKKRNETLASVVSESVVEKLLEEFALNENFIGSHNGETAYIGLLFDVNDIGGLSKKDAKNEDKGAIIELIKNGRIKALITPKLLADECMVIVPDATTIDAMDEYHLLSDISYKVCYVTQQGDVIATDTTVHISDVIAIFQYDDKAQAVWFEKGSHYFKPVNQQPNQLNDDLPVQDISDDFNEDVEYEEETDDEFGGNSNDNEVSEELESDYSEEFSPDDDSEYISDETITDYEPEDEFASDYTNDTEYLEDEVIEEEDDDNEQISDESDADISEEDVKETIVRKFYSDDLGLEITTEPFDVQFANINSCAKFDTNRGDGWLNEYLNNMSANANTEMLRLHNDNLLQARNLYFSLISDFCENIQKRLDIQDDSTKYGKMNNKAKLWRQEEYKNIDNEVSKKVSSINELWEQKLEQVGKDAAQMAQRQYRERFGEAHDAEIFRVEPEMRQKIEDDYNDALRKLNDDRRNEASKLLDYGINATLEEVSDFYKKLLLEEKSRYDRLQQQMLDFIEDNKDSEVTRIAVLKEEQSRSDKVAEVMKQADEQIESMKKDFANKKQELADDLAIAERNYNINLDNSKANYENRIAQLQSDNEVLQTRVDNLLTRCTEIEENKQREYSSRVNELTQEKNAWADKCENMMVMHKRTNIVAGFLMAVAVVAAIAIGIIAGFLFANNINNQNYNYYQTAVSEFTESSVQNNQTADQTT